MPGRARSIHLLPQRQSKLAEKVLDHTTGYVLNVKLRDVEDPPIERVLRVPAGTTFYRLHKIIQTAFEWEDRHLYQFRLYDADSDDFDPVECLVSDPDEWDDDIPHWQDKGRRLSQVFEQRHRAWQGRNVKIVYEYDLGDGWEHEITLLGTDSWEDLLEYGVWGEEREVWCFGGSGGPCEEDCGGPGGWQQVKAQLANDGSNVDFWNIFRVNEDLLQIRPGEVARRDPIIQELISRLPDQYRPERRPETDPEEAAYMEGLYTQEHFAVADEDRYLGLPSPLR